MSTDPPKAERHFLLGPWGIFGTSVMMLGAPVLLVAFTVWILSPGVFIEPKSEVASTELCILRGAMTLYQTRHQPIVDAGTAVDVLVSTGTLDRWPDDPWGRPYLVRDSSSGLLIVTLGRDGRPGGEGQDSDLSVTAIGPAPRCNRR